MPHLHDIYRRLQPITDVSVDQAMAAALPTADAAAIRLIALSLLARQQGDGIVAMVRYYDRFTADIQAQIIRRAPTWDQSLRQVAGYRLPQGPANVVRIIVAARATHLAYLVTEQLRHRPSNIRVLAGEGLLQLTRWANVSGDGHQINCTAAAVHDIQLAVEESFRFYGSHQQPSVLLALAVLTPRPMVQPIGQLTAGRDLAAVAALRRMLAGAQEEDMRRAMLVMVQIPALAQWVLQGISVASCEGYLSDVLSCWHLLISRRVERPLQSIAQPQWLWPTDPQLAHWPARVTVGLAHWAAALPLSDHERAHKLARLTLLPDPMSRLSALRQLIAMSGSPDSDSKVQQAISRFCGDSERQLAWIAIRYLVGCRWQGLMAMLPRLINSPHEQVAQLARELLAPLGFDRLWNGWQRMAFDQRLALGRALVKIDPVFHGQLARKLASPTRLDKLRAMSIAHGLNQGSRFEGVLLELVNHTDVKIASAAVRTLGSVQSLGVVDVLEASLSHENSRVRANAIEALQQLNSTRHVHKIVRMARDETGRPRANAIRALMRMNAGDALAALVQMLNDPKPGQRISALWVVEAMGVLDVARQVAEMSITDSDVHVKERADLVVHNLIGLMKSGTGHQARAQPSGV